jgi:hypothetical protein
MSLISRTRFLEEMTSVIYDVDRTLIADEELLNNLLHFGDKADEVHAMFWPTSRRHDALGLSIRPAPWGPGMAQGEPGKRGPGPRHTSLVQPTRRGDSE